VAKKATKKSAGSRGEAEEPLDLTVTLDDETRPVTLSRMSTASTDVYFKNDTVSVTLSCGGPKAARKR
jgi:hypothetical protein